MNIFFKRKVSTAHVKRFMQNVETTSSNIQMIVDIVLDYIKIN